MKLPALKINTSLAPLAGAAHGLPGPSVFARVGLQGHSPEALGSLRRRLAELGWPDLVAPLQAGNNEPGPWLECLLSASLALQRHLRVPVWGAPRLLASRPPRGGSSTWELLVLLPCASIEATQITLNWLVTAVVRGRADRAVLEKALRAHAIGGVNGYRFLQAAQNLGVSVRRLPLGAWSFGTGRYQRWLESSFTDQTPRIGAALARNKMATARMLAELGLPAPVHEAVGSADEACSVAARLGYPVVVKPIDLDQGKGVAADLRTEVAVRRAYEAASALSRQVMVERHFEGQDYRLTVVDGRLVKTVYRRPGGVVGDAVQPIEALVRVAAQDEVMVRRSRERGTDLLQLDDEARELLAEQGLGLSDIPPAGRFVRLRRRANISAGGSGVLVPADQVHPDNARLAIRAARALRLDIAGIDLLIPDIAVSWLASGALVCEVNSQPQIGSTTSPQIYEEILQHLVGPRHRVPLVLLLAPPGGSDEALRPDLIQRLKSLGAACPVYASQAGVWEDGRQVAGAFPDSFAPARAALASPDCDCVAVCMNLDDIARRGLPATTFDAVAWVGDPAGWPDADPTRRCLSLMAPHLGPLLWPQPDGVPLPASLAEAQRAGLDLRRCDSPQAGLQAAINLLEECFKNG